MAQRSRTTYPRSPHSLTSECGWVTTMLTQPLRGGFVHPPKWSGAGQLAQHKGAPELCVFTWVRGLLVGASAVACVTLDKSCPSLGTLALKI